MLSIMKKYCPIVAIVLFFVPLMAQDVSFSQFNSLNPYYNPALTGAFSGNFRVSTIYRNQWVGFQDRPFTSTAISGDLKFNLGPEGFLKDYIAAGVYFLTDRAQQFDWNNNEVALNFAYHKLLRKSTKDFIGIGFAFGLMQRSVNYDNIYFEDQFDGISRYNGQTNELLPPNIYARPVLKLGTQYNAQLNSKLRLQAAMAIHKLFKPEYSLYSNFEDPDYLGSKSNKALSQFNFIGNFIYQLGNFDELYPRFMMTLNGPHGIFITGLAYRKSFYNLNQTALHAGLSTRIIKGTESISPADIGLQIGFEIKNFIIGLHYDIGIKDQIKYNNATHSFEISLNLLGSYENGGYICPSF